MQGSEPTPDVEAGPRQDVALVVVANQVVARRLPGGVESRQRDTEVGRAQHAVQRAWQRLSVQRPEQRAGVDAQVGVDPAAGRQVGAHVQDGVLGVDRGYVWRKEGMMDEVCLSSVMSSSLMLTFIQPETIEAKTWPRKTNNKN